VADQQIYRQFTKASPDGGMSPREESNLLRTSFEPAVWCIVAIFIALASVAEGRPRLHNDSFQYLVSAEGLRSTHQFATTLIHFDTERSHGTVPAPLTWFPPGYPLAIAFASALGVGYLQAALFVSVLSFALVTAGLWLLT
jgi:hypothetical protein